MTMNGAVLPILALYVVAAEEQGVAPNQPAGTIQNDILKEFMVRNTYIYPPTPSMRIISDIFAFTSQEMLRSTRSRSPATTCRRRERRRTSSWPTRWPTVEYVRARCNGLDVDASAPRLSFFGAIGMNFFMEVAKLRAARLLWSHLMEQFDPKNPKCRRCAPIASERVVAHRPGRVQQRHPHLCRSDGSHPGTYPVTAHQRPRRSACCSPTSRRIAATPSCSCSRRAARPAPSTQAAATMSSGSP